jgi:hypothetical protein
VTDVLERQLTTLAERLDTSATDRLVDDVLARIDAEMPAAHPARSRGWLLLAAAAVVVIVVLALPGPRHAVAHWFGIGSTRIERSPAPLPTTVASPAFGDETAPPETATAAATTVPATFPSRLALGRPTTAADAASRTGLPVPIAESLGDPVGVFVVNPPRTGQVAVAYPPSATLPASDVAGVGALLSTVRGSLADGGFFKLTATGTKVENLQLVTPLGRTLDAVWLEGEPHQLLFVTEDGQELWDTLRLATNTLLWNDNGVIYRFEADIDRETATNLASSIIDQQGTATAPAVSGGS